MFKIASLVALLCAVNFPLIIRPAAAAPAHSVKLAAVIIQLKGAPVAQDAAFKASDKATRFHFRLDLSLAPARWYASQLTTYQDREINYLRGRGIDLTVQYRTRVLYNGIEAIVPTAQLPRLRASANVASVFFQHRPVLFDNQSLPLVRAPDAWSQLGGQASAGKGVFIAQIDTGIDISNPCFRDTNMAPPPFPQRGQLQFTNNKVVVARAFGPDPKITYSARDVEGHGTFGAGIEACDSGTPTPLGDTINGLAPDAYLMSYNVFPKGYDQSNIPFDPILPALEAAQADGADVVNMSLGSPLGSTDNRVDPDEAVVRLLAQSGVPVVVSAGNDGPTAQTVTSPALAPEAIAVGATSNSRALYSSIDVQGPGSVPPQLAAIPASQSTHPFTKTIGPSPMLYVGLARRPGDDQVHPSADDLAGKDLQGKIALIDRGGGVPSFVKFKNVQAAGAAGAIYLDNISEFVVGQVDAGNATLPILFTGHDDGQALLKWVQDHPDATATMDPTLRSTPLPSDVLSDYSSRGYNAGYGIKPDLVAPGTEIYSSTQTETPSGDTYDPSGFTTANGTSFSAPHVTGAVALLLQKFAHPNLAMVATKIGWVKSMLMDTASSRDVYLNPEKTQVPSVMDMGAGLLNVGAAVSSTAFLAPGSLSFGEANVGLGPVSRSSTVSISDAGGGDGAWQVSIQSLHGAPGVAVTAPSSVTLTADSHANVPINLTVGTGATTGDYDGYVVFTRGTETLHVPYFVHVVAQSVASGSVLLVDGTTSLYQAPPGSPQVPHLDATRYYTGPLKTLGKRYTYWDEAKLGTPSLDDLRRASAVVWYTGTNLNGLSPKNLNSEGLQPPLSSADVTVIDQYMSGGGRLFLTGLGAVLGGLDLSGGTNWLAGVMGTIDCDPSVFDTDRTDAIPASNPCPAEPQPPSSALDKADHGGISPPKPSARPAVGPGLLSHVGPFEGFKSIDFSTSGNGAKDNVAVYNGSAGVLLGVFGIAPINANLGFAGSAFGHRGLSVPKRFGSVNIGTVSSDEPSLKHTARYPGRAVLFSFGFEGINDNTGYATRAQVLKRIFQWFADRPSASVTAAHYRAHKRVTLRATLKAGAPARASLYQWQIGGTTLKTTYRSSSYVFPHAGKYRVRALITDTLGHAALSGWKYVTVS